MKLLLGCGDERRDGFMRVDLREEVDPDFVCDVRKLDFCADDSVFEIVAEDILEHLPHFDTRDTLREWHRVLIQGGQLQVKVPNMQMLGRWLADGHMLPAAMRNVFGGHRYGPDGLLDAHHWGFTPDTLRSELQIVGFDVFQENRELNFTMWARKR